MSQFPRRFMRLPAVRQAVGLGRTAIYEKIKSGEFPAPYPLSNNGRAVAWASDEIDRWIESRIQAAGVAK
jgi:prophage regulatory protein